jgi:hypothetical protein
VLPKRKKKKKRKVLEPITQGYLRIVQVATEISWPAKIKRLIISPL